MAPTLITLTRVGDTELADFPDDPGVAADPTNGNAVPNVGDVLLVMNNTDASEQTVSIAVARTFYGLAISPRVHTIPAGTVQLVKLGDPKIHGALTGLSASSAAVKLAAYRR